MEKNSGGARLLHGVRSKSEEGRGSLRRNSGGRIVGSYNLHGKSVYVPNGEVGDKSYQEGHNQIGSQCFGNIGCGRVKMVEGTYTFCEGQVSWTDNLESDHADEMNV